VTVVPTRREISLAGSTGVLRMRPRIVSAAALIASGPTAWSAAVVGVAIDFRLAPLEPHAAQPGACSAPGPSIGRASISRR
jgi:hypothetical protein